jgi:hypothetical protein
MSKSKWSKMGSAEIKQRVLWARQDYCDGVCEFRKLRDYELGLEGSEPWWEMSVAGIRLHEQLVAALHADLLEEQPSTVRLLETWERERGAFFRGVP